MLFAFSHPVAAYIHLYLNFRFKPRRSAAQKRLASGGSKRMSAQPTGGGVYSSISEVSFQAAWVRGAETACFRRQQADVGSADRRQQANVGSAD